MNPRPSFDRIAPFYQGLEWLAFGPLLQRCRIAHIDRLLDCRRALLLGDGDGRFLAALLAANSHVLVDSLDSSSKMLGLAGRRAAAIDGAIGRVRFIHGDACSAAWSKAEHDLIVTNFFLDCFTAEELERLIDRVTAAAAPGALWLDSDFRLPAGACRRAVAELALSGMYLFFVVATRLRARRLTDPAPFLAARGFTLRSEACGLGGFLSSRLWQRSGPAGLE